MMLKGSATLTRSSDDIFRLTLRDDTACIGFALFEMTPEQFANLLSTRQSEGKLTVRGLDKVGTQYENKTVRVPFRCNASRGSVTANLAANTALKPFEADGWKGDKDDLFNGHRGNDDGTYNVTFRRHLRDGKPISP